MSQAVAWANQRRAPFDHSAAVAAGSSSGFEINIGRYTPPEE